MYGFQCSHSSRTVSALEFIRGGASKNIAPSSCPGAYVVQRGAVPAPFGSRVAPRDAHHLAMSTDSSRCSEQDNP